jgi:hypothetical protein
LGANAPEKLLKALSSPITALELLREVYPHTNKVGPREEQLLWYINVVQFLPQERFTTLTENAAIELINWEAEKHRVTSVSGY